MARILVVDDEKSMREFLEIFLRKEGHQVALAANGAEAFQQIDGDIEFDLIVTDLKMPRVTGIDVLDHAKEVSPHTMVIVMTAYSTAETAIEAMKKGAHDYIPKPFKVDEIRVVIEKALEKRNLMLENLRLKGVLKQKFSFSNIIGKSAGMQKVFDLIARVAKTRASVLITGESGTGKELVAKAIHFNSLRKEAPFVVINCGAIPETLMESEMFGHVKGAFTGASRDKKGLFEAADGGSLFLDEIGELSPPLQVKLLRVLQERRIKPVGGVAEREVDVRVIAATNKVLEDEVRESRFREDLYYRLNVITIHLPPLRERQEDIPIIAEHFLHKYVREMSKDIHGITPDAVTALMNYRFVGNVRELENIIERAVTFETGDVLTVDSLPRSLVEEQSPLGDFKGNVFLPDRGVDLEAILADIEKTFLLKALERADGVKTEAAKVLGISFRSIRYKLEKYDISDTELDRFKGQP